jgi:hypothetical protein
VFETLFQFLFEYRPRSSAGRLPLRPAGGRAAGRGVVIAALAMAFVSYRVLRSRVQWRERAVLGALRVAALAIILFCIFRPCSSSRRPSRSRTSSASCSTTRAACSCPRRNTGAGARADRVRQTFANPDSPMMKALSETFLIRTFRFSSSTARVSAPGDLTFGGTQTRLANAIESARPGAAGPAGVGPRAR